MEGKYGEKLENVPEWAGPLKGRSCTDCLCSLIFLTFLSCWAATAYYAFAYGNTSRLLAPTDSEGRKCGVDSEVTDRPHLVFFDLTTCATISTVCDTPQVCVKTCPRSNFLYTNMRNTTTSDELKDTMICKIDIDLTGEDTMRIDYYVETNKCAAWYLASESIAGRCIPNGVWQGFDNLTITASQLTIAKNVVEILTRAERIFKGIYEDLDSTWITLLAILSCGTLISLFYIVLLRWLAIPLLAIAILGVCGLLVYTAFRSYQLYSVGRALGWLIVFVISLVLLSILFLVVFFLRDRIRLACQLIEEASKAVTSALTSLIFPIFPVIFELFVLIFAVSTGLLLASVGTPRYTVEFENDYCVCEESLGYANNSECVPELFNASCTENGGPCTSSGCHLTNIDSPWFNGYLHAVNVIGCFWLFFFVSALGEMVLAGTFATWYWTYRKSDVPFFAITASIWRTFRYHLGTLAFGSLIMTISRSIRVALEMFDQKLRNTNHELARGLLKCCKCCFWLLESFLRFVNRNAYIMCAIHGENFCSSARDAFNLLTRNVIRVVVLNKITDWLLLSGKLFVAGLAAWTTWWHYESSTVVNYWLVPVVLVAIGMYILASMFFDVLSIAVDTLFLCFLEDCERNDGSSEKPYYMSKRLMKLLRRP